MSRRQGHIYFSNLPNDFEHMHQSSHVSGRATQAEQFNDPSFDQILSLDQTAPVPAPGTFYENDTPYHTNWLAQLNALNAYSDPSSRTTSQPVVKHHSTKSKAGHPQGSQPKPRRLQRKQVRYTGSPPSPSICKWAQCTRPGPFSCVASLKRHVDTQHVAPRSIPCLDENCEKVFNRKDNMINHLRSVCSVVL
ncbi:uncharacterized protein N7482_003614 [Penicillium canariense]|uniref:C2H2-type domain-containing protein n=1 Tax=Penicillium canariense TaxID=189055 RepID=A0A9W9I7J3_9EURO|nr:uncharacterized protein N7482_003614 [Penicillium canariense]KAJ5168020.1 hypothetical protein N7482_003614 [Penicillium canariense]